MRLVYYWIGVLSFGIIIFLFVCIQPISIAKRNESLCIVCTTSIIADTVRHIVGNNAKVIALMGPGVDPHVYRARESDVNVLAHADIVFYTGLHLEGKLADVLASLAVRIPTVAVGDAIERDRLLQTSHGTYDPHIWHDVQLWMAVVQYISNVLIQHDSAHAIEYNNNTKSYLQELYELDAYVRQQAHTIPVAKRVMVTAHDAFSYFGRAYGFSVVGLQGISTEAEIGIKDVEDLAQYIVHNNIPVIFLETSIAPRSMHAVQQAVAAYGRQVALGPELFSDALGDSTTNADSYCDMIKHNIDAVVLALQY